MKHQEFWLFNFAKCHSVRELWFLDTTCVAVKQSKILNIHRKPSAPPPAAHQGDARKKASYQANKFLLCPPSFHWRKPTVHNDEIMMKCTVRQRLSMTKTWKSLMISNNMSHLPFFYYRDNRVTPSSAWQSNPSGQRDTDPFMWNELTEQRLMLLLQSQKDRVFHYNISEQLLFNLSLKNEN